MMQASNVARQTLASMVQENAKILAGLESDLSRACDGLEPRATASQDKPPIASGLLGAVSDMGMRLRACAAMATRLADDLSPMGPKVDGLHAMNRIQ